MDSGKPLSGRAERHLRRCTACREFAWIGTELERRLRQDGAVLLGKDRGCLGEKVLLSLDRRVKLPSVPRRILRKPVWTAAGIAAIVLAAVVLARHVWFVTPHTEKMPSLVSLLKYDVPGVYLKKAAEKAESPYQQEIRKLKKALGAAANVIEASFNIGLGEKSK